MKKFEVLDQLEQKSLSVKDAYNLMYGYQFKLKKAHFVKLRIKIEESKGVSTLLRIIFLFPIPIFMIKWALKLALKNSKGHIDKVPLTVGEISELISYRGLLVNVDAHDEANILIKTF